MIKALWFVWGLVQTILPLYARDKRSYLIGLVCFVGLIGWVYVGCTMNGQPKSMSPPDKIANIAMQKVLSVSYEQDKELFWNPYAFGGMPFFASLSGSNLRTFWLIRLVAKNFWVWFFSGYAYCCLRLNPSGAERRFYYWCKEDFTGFPNGIILAIIMMAVSVILRYVVVAVKLIIGAYL